MKNEKRKGDRQLEKDNKETIAQENVEKQTLVQEENKEKENKKTNTKEDKKETKIKEEKSSSDSVEDTNQKSKGRFVVPAIIAVILIAFAGVIIWQNFIKPKTDINDKLGFNTDDYITVGNIKGLTYDLTQKEWDESINEDTDYTEDVNRASKSGDEISFSYTAYINNKKIEDLSEKEQSIDLGSYDSGIYKLFSDKIIGVKKGDKVTVKVTDGKEANELSRKKLDYTGKKITYKLSVEAVSEKHRDKITDQWVKDNYYEALGLSNKKEYYQWQKEYLIEENVKVELWNKALEKVTLKSVPSEYYQQIVDEMDGSVAASAKQEGLSVNEYKIRYGLTDEVTQENYNTELKSMLLMWHIVKQEGFKASKEEIEEEYENSMDDAGVDTVEEMKKLYTKDEMEELVLLDKAQNFVYENAKVTFSYKIKK